LPAEAQLPTSLAIASNGDPAASAQITVVGWRGDVAIDRRDHLVENVPTERVAALAVVLSARCTALVSGDSSSATSRCPSGETCAPSSGACATGRIDATGLPTATTPEAALPDAGAATDGGANDGAIVDAGGLETSVDGGPIDNYATAVLADGPRAYFRFEETSGSACKNDGSDPTVTCAYAGSGLTRGVAGSGGGRTGVRLDDKVAQVNVFGAMDYVGNVPFTIEAWLSFDELAASDDIFTNQTFGVGTRDGQFLGIFDDLRIRTETWFDGGLVFYTISKAPAAAQRWIHVVYGHSDTDQKDFLYMDGALGEGNRTGPGEHIAMSVPLSFTGGKFTLDDVAIYSKALSPSQIAAHFTAQ
jgi:hypothetical protein